MTRYLISFDHGAMDHIPDEEGSAVGEAAHAVVQEAMDAGVFVFAGGCEEASVVATDGTVSDAPEGKAYIGGLTIVDVPSRDAALQWAAKIAVACRCAQEVRAFMLLERLQVGDQLGDLLVREDPAPVRHAHDRRAADHAAAADDVRDCLVRWEVVAEALPGERWDCLVRRRRVRHAAETVRPVAVDAAVADVEGGTGDRGSLPLRHRDRLRV